MRDHRTLKETYELTARLPRREMFGVRAQMRRAALSVASNIQKNLVISSLWSNG
jgi:four helix bundle protein